MMDPLFDNLAERFAGHEMDVDPGTWSAISGQLAVASGGSLSGLLQEKFAGHEAPVDPQVWTNISSQLGHGAAAGVGSTAGWWAAGIAATLVAGGLLVYNFTDEPAATDLAEKAQVAAPSAPEQQPVAQPFTTETASIPSASLTADVSTTSLAPVNPKKGASPAAKSVPNEKKSQASDLESLEEPEQLDPNHPMPTPEGKVAVKSALQGVVDNYMTSIDVVSSEPKVPPPSQEEMPSKAVHVQHDEPELDETEPDEPEIHPAAPELAVMIPTAFSPNSDGVNDELVVTVQNYKNASVRIFSASSNALVFWADNLEARWNGTMLNSGQPCEPGMYFYALEVTGADGRTWTKGEVVRLFQR
jgi:gliding motility-associated-like protein